MLVAAGAICAVALTSDACIVVTASEDFTARVWDCATGRELHVLRGHSGWVVGLALTPDAGHVLTASHDGTARCAGLTLPHQCHGLHLQAMASWNASHLTTLTSKLWSHCMPARLAPELCCVCRVWGLHDGQCVRVLSGHAGRLNGVRLSPGPDPLAITFSDDFTSCIWDWTTGICRQVRALDTRLPL